MPAFRVCPIYSSYPDSWTRHHFSIVCVCVCVCVCVLRCSVMSDFLRAHGLYPTRLLCPWDSPGANAGVGCHFLLQGIFPTQGSPVSPALAGRFFTHRAFCVDSLTGSRTFTKAPSRRYPSPVVFPHLAGVESAGGLVLQGI